MRCGWRAPRASGSGRSPRPRGRSWWRSTRVECPCAGARTAGRALDVRRIGYTQLDAKDTDPVLGSLKFSPKLVTGVFGYQFTPNLAVEGMLGMGAGKSRIKLDGVDTGMDGKVKNAVGVFFKPSVAVADSVDLFGRIGWVRSELELSAGGFSDSETNTDIAYGMRF